MAIVGGTGYRGVLDDADFVDQTVATPFGTAQLAVGQGDVDDIIFVARHGRDRSIPPHRVNYRANLMALSQMGVERIIGLSAVGGLTREVPPGAIVIVDQLIDWTSGRAETFFDGGEWGVAHVDVTEPFCKDMRRRMLDLQSAHGLAMQSEGVYVACKGPRLETAAEIRMYASLGGTVVGMTGAPEASLARELGMHFASVCTSINNAAGLDGESVKFDGTQQAEQIDALLSLSIAALRAPAAVECACSVGPRILHEPTAWTPPRRAPAS
ncbi:MAG: S-methyl-5'-thioinosine phosphorylase [Acidimicrobiia bacterium]